MRYQAILWCVIGSMGLCGCVTTPDDSDDPCAEALALGTITVVDHPVPYMMGAPHGQFDLYTAEIAHNACMMLGWDCIIAEGFIPNQTRINVNRPTEGAGLSPAAELWTTRAQCVYDAYLSAAQGVGASGGPSLYVEVHGAGINTIEIATVGVDTVAAQQIKDILQAQWDAGDGSAVVIEVEPVDMIRFTAGAAKTFGIFTHFAPALHIEFPRPLREHERRDVEAFLRDGLSEVVEQVFP